MPSVSHLQKRRSEFLARLDGPALLMAGGARSRNYPDNTYPYRADGSFLFFFNDVEPESAALFDPAAKSVTLFLPERTPESALWHGAVPDFAAMKQRHGVDEVLGIGQLETEVRRRAAGRRVHTVAVADERASARARGISGVEHDFYAAAKVGAPNLVRAIADLRLTKSEEEVAVMRKTARATHEAHVAAMRATRPGVSEQEIAGIVEGSVVRAGFTLAYNTILSVRGEVLHNHDHGNICQNGDILLLDAGAEDVASGYCSDVTRSWPVSGKFSPEQADIYDLVLKAELAAIAKVKAGVRYRDVHLTASLVLAEGLVDLGLLIGEPSGLVESGAHAMFFPHGVGHLIGIDVHDMEAFGDVIAYAPGRSRSPQFGTKYLRLDLDLAPGMTVTIEPGIYFVPAILHHSEFRERYRGQIDFDRAERWLGMNDGRGFGGIRIEDDVLCTSTGREVLTASIPKERREVESVVGKS